MKETCVVSCCYAPNNPGHYAKFADRLEANLDKFHPELSRIIWRDSWPPGSPSHSQLHYGFKFYAMQYAFTRGYKQVIWLDAGTELLAPLDPVFDRLNQDGYALLTGPDVLGEWISDGALAYLGATREHAMKLKLAGGCLIGLDLDFPVAQVFFNHYKQLAQATRHFMCYHSEQSIRDGVMRSVLLTDGDNIPVSSDPRVKGHRSDEACFSVLMDKLGMRAMTTTDWHAFARTYQDPIGTAEWHRLEKGLQEVSMLQKITSKHETDAHGNPAGGKTTGVGLEINWQSGPLGRGADRAEPNGAFVEGVIAAALDRIEYYQSAGEGKFKCRENALAITKLEEALMWLQKRTIDREAREVEGTHTK